MFDNGLFNVLQDELHGDAPVFGAESDISGNVTPHVSGSVKVGQLINNITGATSANAFTSQENALARSFNAAQSLAQFNRELYADSTKYQRSMADLEAAGINPILAVQGMNVGNITASSASAGASSGTSGAGATIISAITRGISQIVSSAIRAIK